MKRLYEDNFDTLFKDCIDIENLTIQQFNCYNDNIVVMSINDTIKKRIIVKSKYILFMLNYFHANNTKEAIVFKNENFDLQCSDFQLTQHVLIETCENYLQEVFDDAEDLTDCIYIKVRKSNALEKSNYSTNFIKDLLFQLNMTI
ncbi:MAG: hypothetical protein ACXADW_13515 [Candidatus Hodarchaeales archaeon]|jgi:hypothetical protein